ncbi:MAG: guanylate kinase [Bacteroidota bacterium]|nr:guanylate kinase [Bacteroidota bacterium]
MNSKKENKIIAVCGVSGSGKTTLVHSLITNEELNLHFSISACTRERRKFEQDGKDYIFLSVPEFKKKIKNQMFLEWEEVYKNKFYGTLKNSTYELLKSGKNVLFDIDVKGALSLKNLFKDNALTIFVTPPSLEIARKRLAKRNTEKLESYKLRSQKMDYEISFSNKMDVTILNSSLESSKFEILNIVKEFLKK